MASAPGVIPLTAPDTESYDRLQIIAHERTHRRVLEIFDGFPQRGTLLEVPAGEGALAWQLQKLGYTVTAGDIDPKFFKVRPIPCIYVDLNSEFPFEGDRFDFVSCTTLSFRGFSRFAWIVDNCNSRRTAWFPTVQILFCHAALLESGLFDEPTTLPGHRKNDNRNRVDDRWLEMPVNVVRSKSAGAQAINRT